LRSIIRFAGSAIIAIPAQGFIVVAVNHIAFRAQSDLAAFASQLELALLLPASNEITARATCDLVLIGWSRLACFTTFATHHLAAAVIFLEALVTIAAIGAERHTAITALAYVEVFCAGLTDSG